MKYSYDIEIKKYKVLPTKWTGESGQQVDREDTPASDLLFPRVENLEEALEIIMYHYKHK